MFRISLSSQAMSISAWLFVSILESLKKVANDSRNKSLFSLFYAKSLIMIP